MHSIRSLLALTALFFGLSMNAAPAQAETFHTCGTIIASIPAVISSQGVYCLSHDVNTSITVGSAIDVQANNVTLDCNGFKLGGLAAGAGSSAVGIRANFRQNLTVRNCTIRGFYEGIYFSNGAGHLIEDNRFDNNLYIGIDIEGDNDRVRRNAVYDTGGSPSEAHSYGIVADADVIDNTVAGVFGTGANSSATGIWMLGDGTEARGNQVRGLQLAGTGTGTVYGFDVAGKGVAIRGNSLALSAATFGWGIAGNGATDTFCTGNTIAKFSTAIASCQTGTDNLSN